MTSPNNSNKQKLSEELLADRDYISHLPSYLIDKILKHLPLTMVAKTSVLSKRWRNNWLSHRYFVFEEDFANSLGEGHGNENRTELLFQQITKILNHHNGPIHKFHLELPDDPQVTSCTPINPWLQWLLSTLSKSHVKKIALFNFSNRLCFDPPILCDIYKCKDIVKLTLSSFNLDHPLSDFEGFQFLRSLKLFNVNLDDEIFKSVIERCPVLRVLKLELCSMGRVMINVPNLETLIFEECTFNYLGFKNVTHLENVSLSFDEEMEMGDGNEVVVIDSLGHLANSCHLKKLEFGGRLSQLLVAGGVTKSLPLLFKHLNRLRFTEINLGRLDEFWFVLGMLQSCPCIEVLVISLKPNNDEVEYRIDCNDDHKFSHLLKVAFWGISGSSAELKLIEYVLSKSPALKYVCFKCRDLGGSSEKVLRNLLKFHTASENYI